jgi:hypothetical protein
MIRRTNKRGAAVYPKTVRILAHSIARLSPDLMIAKRFLVIPDPKALEIHLVPISKGGCKTWLSSPKAKSALISLAGAFSAMTLPRHKAGAVYPAKLTNAGRSGEFISIDLHEPVKP